MNTDGSSTPRAAARCAILGLALALALTDPAALSGQQAPPAPAPSSTITGLVTEADTGVPITGALVIVEGAGRAGRTGPRGTFAIDGIPAGTYTLRVRQFGYRDTALRVRVAAGARVRHTLILAPDPLQLEGLTVTGEARNGLVGLVIDEVSRQPLANTLLRLEPHSAALTDSIGVFALRDLPDDPGLLRVDQFGYEPLYLVVPDDRSQILEIALRPRAIEVEGLTVEAMQANVAEMTRRMTQRQNAAARPVRSWNQRQLAALRSPDLQTFFEFESPVLFMPCPRRSAATDCVMGRRGAPVPMVICIDEMPAPGGMLQLGGYRPDELYRLEVYSRGALVLAYTRSFMDQLARRRRNLIPLDYLRCTVV